MTSGNAGLECQLELTDAACVAPVAEQRSNVCRPVRNRRYCVHSPIIGAQGLAVPPRDSTFHSHGGGNGYQRTVIAVLRQGIGLTFRRRPIQSSYPEQTRTAIARLPVDV